MSIQAFGIRPINADLEIEHISEQLAVVRHGGMAWTYCTPLMASPRADSAYIDSAHALDRIRSLLGETGARVDQIIRTWFYLGGIIANECFTPRYKEFNRAREDFYEPIQFLAHRVPKNHERPIYPASTCIGAEGRDLTACAIALTTERNDIFTVPLENPRQTAAYKYGAGHGLGSPKFSRAMALSCGESAMIFVSGTASIKDAETRHIGDVSAQTHETLANIETLISEDNLHNHGLPGLGASLRDFGTARVYVKRQEDYGIVREICQKRMGDIPTIFTTADICRRELLVEIEGIVFSKKSANQSKKTSVPRPHFFLPIGYPDSAK